jgi:hypothetical protein
MALYYPIIVDSTNSLVKELPANDTLNLSDADIITRNLQLDGYVHQTIETTTGACNLANAAYFKITLSSGSATVTITNPPANTASMFMIEVVNTGSYSVVWPVSIVWDGGTAPSLPASTTSIFTFLTSNSGSNWRGNLVLNTSA